MEDKELQTVIHDVFKDVFEQHVTGATFPELESDTVLLNTGLDSLGFAIIVTQLEEELGFDPFSLSSDAYYPQTYREFVDFYTHNKP